MNEIKRKKKKAIALITILAFFAFLIFIIYLIAKPEPSCYDGLKNQREKGVDCGGPCAPCAEVIQTYPLNIVKAEFIHFEGNKYDVVLKIKNPNDILGAGQATIKIQLIDENERALSEISYDEFFILPKEEKYVLIYGVETEGTPFNVKAEIGETVWKKFSQYEEPRLIIINKNYEKSSGGVAWFSQAKGTLINKSGADFEKINVSIILRNSTGKLLAVNSQVMNTVRAGEQRDFISSFSRSFPGDVADMQIQAETNIFNSENYIKIHGAPEDRTEK